MRFLSLFCSCILLLLAVTGLRAQVNFSIQASAPEIFKNDVLQVEYTIANGGAISRFVPPVFKGWVIHSGPMISQEESIINGKSNRKTSYIYALAPERPGTLSLPATTVVVAGQTLSCAAIQIKVANKDNPSPLHTPPPASLQSLFGEEELDNSFAQAPLLKHGEDPAGIIRSHTFIKVIPSKTKCYTGEPVMVTYQLYTGLPSSPTPGKPPYFSGCSVTEIPFEQQFATEKIGGKNFRVTTIRKVQLIPLQPGALNLGETSIENEVTFRVEDQQYRSQAYKLTIKNTPSSIEVLPLPGKQPAGFSGVVGNFTITVQPRSDVLPAQENNTLVITIGGKGDLTHIITPPTVEWPAGLEHYEATSKDQINNTVVPYEGYRSFEIPFLATQEGKLTIPPVRFSFFDPEKHSYQTVASDSIPLQFTKATGNSYRDDPAFKEDRTTRQYIWIVPALALVVITILFFNARNEKKKKAVTSVVTTVSAPVELPIARTDFTAAVQLLDHIEDHQLFFNKCKELLCQALAETTGLPSTATIPSLLATLTGKQHESAIALADRCRQFFTNCDLALYAPAGHEAEREWMLEELRGILEDRKRFADLLISDV